MTITSAQVLNNNFEGGWFAIPCLNKVLQDAHIIQISKEAHVEYCCMRMLPVFNLSIQVH